MRRARLSALLLAGAILLPASAATADATFTTFQARSEGCSGGGEVCGVFPVVRAGSAEYDHVARSDGSVELSASASGGTPSVCVPGYLCPQPLSQYHAEAAGMVWIDFDIPGGARAATVRTNYRLTELAAEASAVVGRADADVIGSVYLTEIQGSSTSTCSDSSDVAGQTQVNLDHLAPPGDHTLVATVRCAQSEGLLPPTRWRAALWLKVEATTDGGEADARARAALTSVSVAA